MRVDLYNFPGGIDCENKLSRNFKDILCLMPKGEKRCV
jgi:hypothetical protein